MKPRITLGRWTQVFEPQFRAIMEAVQHRPYPVIHQDVLMGWMIRGRFVPVVRGAARDHDIFVFENRVPAVAATVIAYFGIPAAADEGPAAFVAEGFYWLYEVTEGGTDNTVDFNVTHGAAGTGTTVYTNVNPNGMLDTGAPSTLFTNRRDAASSGAAAAAAADPGPIRVVSGNVIQSTLVTAGTAAVAARLGVFGHWV